MHEAEGWRRRAMRRPPVELARAIANVLSDHVTLEVKCIDRMYLNAYVPLLQTAGGSAYYLRTLRGYHPEDRKLRVIDNPSASRYSHHRIHQTPGRPARRISCPT